MTFTPEQIAQVCHEANRGVQRLLGEQVNFPWESTSPALRESCIDGVNAIIEGRTTQPADSHNNWLEFKRAEGWQYGPVKDFAKKEHPQFVPYDALPPEQQAKDEVFFAIVKALSPQS